MPSGVATWLALLAAPAAAADNLGLNLGWHEDGAWLDSTPAPATRLRVMASDDCFHWTEWARVNDRLFPYPDTAGGRPAARFYRLEASPRGTSDDWSNQVVAGAPELFKPGTGSGLAGMASLKWSLRVGDASRVYFQDSVAYPYHIQFARARLPEFAGVGAVEFAAQSLYPSPAQRLALGSVFRAPDPSVRELGIELTGSAAFPAAQAAEWIDSVRRRVHAPPGWRVLYMPSSEQSAETQAHPEVFAARGITVSTLGRWATAHACYSAGWAFGRLVRVPATEVPAALAEGRLRLDDILVTDRVPSELPVLAGYLALEPATPNSHVALLARASLLPFAYVNGGGFSDELTTLLGREVLLHVEETETGCRLSAQDTTGRLSPERRQEIIESKRRPLAITPVAHRGAIALPTDALTPSDIAFVGGKAAHFGFLRRSLPDHSPHPAIALTFDLWQGYLNQPAAGAPTLREFIRSRLSRHSFPPHIATLRADLQEIRTTVEKSSDFTQAQRDGIVSALQAAGLVGANIRFRSSTNVEDGDTFNGAGLYDSFSGCLEDDLDGDTVGPSHCDPTEPNERGVFRALRKVFASFYNENAVLERLRYGINEDQVGMAVLVHFSSPDSTEMANGVATFSVTTNDISSRKTARIVSQPGATSVTNPSPGQQAEIVVASFEGIDPSNVTVTLEQPSSLTPLGTTAMTWVGDYRTLVAQMFAVSVAYGSSFPHLERFELDFEFKKRQPGVLELKQVRPVPQVPPVPVPTIP